MRRIKTPARPRARVRRQEWDFSRVTPDQERACCYYEYARETKYVMQNLDPDPNPTGCYYDYPLESNHDQNDPQHQQLLNSPLTVAMQRPPDGSRFFEGPWLLKDGNWRKRICGQFEEHGDGLDFARLLPRIPDRAFQIGIAPPFPSERWTEMDTRVLDQKTGLELLLVTIDWANFQNRELVKEFKKWTKVNRPPNVGEPDTVGEKTNVYRKSLEKLTVLRLRHHYPFKEIGRIIPQTWTGDKYHDKSEMTRTCKAACDSLRLLFPFLETGTLPLSWEPFRPIP